MDNEKEEKNRQLVLNISSVRTGICAIIPLRSAPPPTPPSRAAHTFGFGAGPETTSPYTSHNCRGHWFARSSPSPPTPKPVGGLTVAARKTSFSAREAQRRPSAAAAGGARKPSAATVSQRREGFRPGDPRPPV